jgi:hypothetical protein
VSDDQREQSNERFAGDLLRGAHRIGAFISSLGFDVTTDGVYYLHKKKSWPISKYGKDLIASKSKLTRHAHKLTSS